jgi:hypothetical protein
MTQVESEKVMSFRHNTMPKSIWVVGSVALMIGAFCGLLYGRRMEVAPQEGAKARPVDEIIVSKSRGLVFKSEDGTPLLKIGQDSWGTHVSMLSSSGAPILQLNNLQDRGGVVIGSKSGNFAYIQAQDEAATITLLGKYNKEAVEITSATQDGSGNLFINDGKKGYHAVEIRGEPNRAKSRGTITIPNETGTNWQAP